MGRELQKRKRRTGAQPVRRPPSSKKKILANPVIRDNWNKKETLAQNYKRIGLVSRLNKRAGGTQKRGADTTKGILKDPFAISSKPLRRSGVVEEVALVRDAQTGELQVPLERRRANPLNDALNELDDDFSSEDGDDEDHNEHQAGSRQGNWITPMGHIGEQNEGVAQTNVTASLEEIAMSGKEKKPRHQSGREEEWIEQLVHKYGDDYEVMFRDRRLNVMQQSQGDIKKRVKKWLAKQKK